MTGTMDFAGLLIVTKDSKPHSRCSSGTLKVLLVLTCHLEGAIFGHG